MTSMPLDSDGHYSFDVSAEDETWFRAQVELVRALADDEEPAGAPVALRGAPIIFLDLDDVLCLCIPYGGLDAVDCVTAKRIDVDEVYGQLFHQPAIDVLRQVHDHLDGRLRYVISSTWRQHFTRAQLRHVLRSSGLGFVADCMEDGGRWATPTLEDHDRRAEIGAWLKQHHVGEPFVVIDDHLSGASLESSLAYPLRVALCEPGEGLGERHAEQLLRALRTAWRDGVDF